jgi:16S rRNA C967 or C1407 C5-methylase (RsmB/RsmF family)
MLQLNPELDIVTSRKTVQLWPHRNNTDAMFLALIRKEAK